MELAEDIFLFDGTHGALTRLKLFDGQFDRKEWLTEQTYSENFAKMPEGPGVYMIVEECKDMRKPPCELDPVVLYIGMSTNLSKRCTCKHEVWRQHDNDFGYSRFWFRPIPKHLLQKVEKILIQSFKPRYNIACLPRK